MNQRSSRNGPARTGALIYRGPQALSAPHVSAANYPPPMHAPNAALLIDFDNVTMGIRSDLGKELRTFLRSEIIKGKVAVQRAYADWRRYPQYMVPLAESSVDTIQATAYGSSKKNATDIRLAVDAMELVFTRPEIGTYILLSGDSDFASLVNKLKEYGKYVIGVGIRASSSDLLVMNCDEYYSYDALAGLVKNSEEEEAAKKWDPWELVTEAVTRMKRNGDVMRSDRLKQVMVEIDNTFDEKDLGMAKFSRFVQDATQRGLLSANKLENGQLEIGLPSGARGDLRAAENAAADEAARTDPAAVKAADDAKREGGRGRRGRRGRGRDRDDRPRAGAVVVDGEAVPSVDVVIHEVDADEEILGPSFVDAPAVVRVQAEPAHRGQRGRTPKPAPTAPAARSDSAEQVGVSGERLTRDEAFDLIRRATAALTKGDETVRAGVVRVKVRELLGRDSESLSDRNFPRILKDAHDGDVIDLRRRGDDFEIARAAEAESVSEQLAKTAANNAPPAASAPVVPRGMGPRGVSGGRGRGMARGEAPPANLLIGVVGPASSVVATAVAHTPVSVTRADAAPGAPVKAARRKTAAKKSAAKVGTTATSKAAAKKSPAVKRAAAKTPRAKKTVARAEA